MIPVRRIPFIVEILIVFIFIFVLATERLKDKPQLGRKRSTKSSRPENERTHGNINGSIHPSYVPPYSSALCASDDESIPRPNHESARFENKNDVGNFAVIGLLKISVSSKNSSTDRCTSRQSIEDPARSKPVDNSPISRRVVSVNANSESLKTPKSNCPIISTSGQLKDKRPTQTFGSQKAYRAKYCNEVVVDYNSDSSSSSETGEDSDGEIAQTPRKLFLKVDRNPNSVSNLKQSTHSNSQHNSDLTTTEKSTRSIQDKFESIKASNQTMDSLPNTDKEKSLALRIRTLCQTYHVKIPNDTTMKDLINIAWCEIKFSKERYAKESHVLLLFNHRLHIFVESDPNTLIRDFLLLSPFSHSSGSDPIDFYAYGLPIQRAPCMYSFDDDFSSIFGNPESWSPSYFIDYKQSERSQSVLLSSLYALRLYFRSDAEELKATRIAMEAQFFLQLRKYIFPPAILALKYSIDGSMFWFEKALIIDALIQLLTHLCNPETVFAAEICDFIPLLICWILEQCNPTEEKEDCFREVRLINDRKRQRSYFQNPVTTSKGKRQILSLEEFEERTNNNELQYHVDIRSVTLYLSRLANNSLNVACKCDHYVLYDPILQDASILESFKYWTETEMKALYKTIARTEDYRSFSILTRGSVTAHVKNQLVLLEKDRTVAILFSPKKVVRADGRTPRDVDHFFEIFDPLQCTKDKSCLVVASDTFMDGGKQITDPRLPPYFNESLTIAKTNFNSSLNENITIPAQQVTVILLDRSRSMSDYRIISLGEVNNYSHIDMCKIMLGRLCDNLFSAYEGHAFGLIEFATKCKTVCPITRSPEQLDKALNFDECSGDWTCMYDAIREAIRQIRTFADSPIRAGSDCKKLIICLSDGLNNYGNAAMQDLQGPLKKNDITIDFISFIRDDQLTRKEDIDKAQQFRKLCADSGGYVYRNLPASSNIELASIFEQEAAIWLSRRSRTSRGIIDKPERYIPPAFEEAAVRRPSSDGTVQSSSHLRRILNEFHKIPSHLSDDVIVFAVAANINFWKVILKGPVNTPYQGKFWMLFVEFQSNYPNYPPRVFFVTPIYHVNISGDGKICHQILGRCWCLQTKMSTVFENILDLLKKPNFDDGVSLEKAHLYKENPDGYRSQAVAHSNKYAKNDVETLKRQYRLDNSDGTIQVSS